MAKTLKSVKAAQNAINSIIRILKKDSKGDVLFTDPGEAKKGFNAARDLKAFESYLIKAEKELKAKAKAAKQKKSTPKKGK